MYWPVCQRKFHASHVHGLLRLVEWFLEWPQERVTNWVGGLKQEEFIVSQSWRPEVRKRNWFLMKGPEGGSGFMHLFQLLVVADNSGISWLENAALPPLPHLHVAFLPV